MKLLQYFALILGLVGAIVIETLLVMDNQISAHTAIILPVMFFGLGYFSRYLLSAQQH